MRKSVVAGVAAVVVAAAVALFFLLDHGDAPAGLKLKPDAEGAADARAAARRGTAAPEQPESRQVDAIRPTSFVDPEVAAATRTTVDDDALRVLVVEEATGLPVPEAEVAWSDGRVEAESLRGVYVNPSSVVADFDHAPLRVLANDRGVALIRTSPRLVIAARSGAMFGSRSFNQPQPPRGEVRVSIQPGVFLAARVVTGGGEPVPGMLVRLDVQQQRVEGKRGGTMSRTVNAVSRAPDGVAIGEHMPAKPEDANAPVEISAIIEGSPPKEAVKVPLGKLKEGPITLVTGPMGRLTVKLQEPDGKPYFGDARVSLTVTRNKNLWTELRAAASGGTASFPWVPVGAALALSAEPEGFDSVLGVKAGPLSSAGEEQAVELRFARKRAVLVGRAVNESGSPVCGATMQAELLASNGMLVFRAPASVTTDGVGSFKIPVDRGSVREWSCDLELEVRGAADQVDRLGFVTLPKLSEAEETSVGDVKLVRPEAIASGVVEDELGAPVPGALVTAEQLRLPGTKSASFVVGKRNLSPADRLRARTNEAGVFEIPMPLRPRARPTSFTLRAEAEGYVCTAALDGVQPGAKLQKIVVRGTGVIQGRLLLPEPAPVRRIEIVVRRSAADAPAVQKFGDCVNSDGSFTLRGILPGAVTVAVRRIPPGVDLAELGDVMVLRLAATDDARLRPLDLRDHPAMRP